MWGIVEYVYDDKVYVVFEDRSRKVYINSKGLDIKENNQVYIKSGKIEKVKEFNEELYKEIKSIQEELNKKIN